MLGKPYRKQRCHLGVKRDSEARTTWAPLTCTMTLPNMLGLSVLLPGSGEYSPVPLGAVEREEIIPTKCSDCLGRKMLYLCQLL